MLRALLLLVTLVLWGCAPVAAPHPAPNAEAPPQQRDYRACVAGEPAACKRAAAAYLAHKARLPASHTTRGLFAKTCGRPYPIEPSRCMAAALFARACDRDDGEGCLRFAYLAQARGWIDAKRAHRLFARSCELRAGEACHRLALLGSEEELLAAAELHARACKHRHGAGCTALAALSAQGKLGAPNQRRAATFYDQGCEAGDAAGCVALGIMRRHGMGGARDVRAAATLFERACEANNANGCRQLGRLLERGDGPVVADPPAAYERFRTAVRLYRPACDRGERAACAALGGLLRAGRGIAADETGGVALQRRACEAGEVSACAAWMTRGGFLLARNKPAALRAIARRCAQGDGLGCFMVGRIGASLFEQQGVPLPAGDPFERGCRAGHGGSCNVLGLRRFPAAIQERNALARSCALGDVVGCHHLAASHLLPGAGSQREAAAPLFRRACDGGYGPACGRLAELMSRGEGIVLDPIRAASHFNRACQLGDMAGCWQHGRMLVQGASVTPDPARGRRLLARACKREHGPACLEQARALLRRRVTPALRAQARKLKERACTLGDAAGCLAVASELRDEAEAAREATPPQGAGRQQDDGTLPWLVRADEAARAGCERAVAICHEDEARSVKRGWRRHQRRWVYTVLQPPRCGVALERVCGAAASAARQRCDAEPESCRDAASLMSRLRTIGLASADDVTAVDKGASDASQQGCRDGDADACMWLADAYRRGRGRKANPARARHYQRRACRLDPKRCPTNASK